MSAWSLNVKDIVKQFLVYRECVVPTCAKQRYLHMDICEVHFKDDEAFARHCNKCDQIATFYNGHCFRCCQQASNKLYADLQKHEITDVTLAAQLRLLEEYKALGNLETLAQIVDMYTIEKDAEGLAEEPELGDPFAELKLPTWEGVLCIKRKPPLNS